MTNTSYRNGVGLVYEAEIYDRELQDKIKNGLAEVSPVVMGLRTEPDTDRVLEIGGIRDLGIVARGASESNSISPGQQTAAMSAEALSAALFTIWAVAIGAAGSVDRLIVFFTFGITLGVLRVIMNNLWTAIGFHLAFQWVAQFTVAAVRAGFVRIEGYSAFTVVALWLFPIVFGGIVLVAVSVRRGRPNWREPHPDPPHGAAET